MVDSGSLTDPVPLGSRRRYYAAFVNDDFKVNNRLTLNLGLRWEFQPPSIEVGNRLSSWDPNTTDPVSGLPGAYTFAGNCSGCTGQRYFGVRKLFRDWGPRIAFAYRAPGEWVIRGAYGIMYEGDVNNSGSGPSRGRKHVAWESPPAERRSRPAVERPVQLGRRVPTGRVRARHPRQVVGQSQPPRHVRPPLWAQPLRSDVEPERPAGDHEEPRSRHRLCRQ
jgi:hypothetical protein